MIRTGSRFDHIFAATPFVHSPCTGDQGRTYPKLLRPRGGSRCNVPGQARPLVRVVYVLRVTVPRCEARVGGGLLERFLGGRSAPVLRGAPLHVVR